MHPGTLSTHPSSWPRFPGRACGERLRCRRYRGWLWQNMAKYGKALQCQAFSHLQAAVDSLAEDTWQWHKLCTVARIKCVASWLPHHSPARLGSCRMWHSNNAKPSHHCFMQSNDPLSWFESHCQSYVSGGPKNELPERSICCAQRLSGTTVCFLQPMVKHPAWQLLSSTPIRVSLKVVQLRQHSIASLHSFFTISNEPTARTCPRHQGRTSSIK